MIVAPLMILTTVFGVATKAQAESKIIECSFDRFTEKNGAHYRTSALLRFTFDQASQSLALLAPWQINYTDVVITDHVISAKQSGNVQGFVQINRLTGKASYADAIQIGEGLCRNASTQRPEQKF
jgi:hypothetical protein